MRGSSGPRLCRSAPGLWCATDTALATALADMWSRTKCSCLISVARLWRWAIIR